MERDKYAVFMTDEKMMGTLKNAVKLLKGGAENQSGYTVDEMNIQPVIELIQACITELNARNNKEQEGL